MPYGRRYRRRKYRRSYRGPTRQRRGRNRDASIVYGKTRATRIATRSGAVLQDRRNFHMARIREGQRLMRDTAREYGRSSRLRGSRQSGRGNYNYLRNAWTGIQELPVRASVAWERTAPYRAVAERLANMAAGWAAQRALGGPARAAIEDIREEF